jgi:hypothetical protein
MGKGGQDASATRGASAEGNQAYHSPAGLSTFIHYGNQNGTSSYPTPALRPGPKPAPSPEEVDEIPQSNSPTKEAHELLNSPPPARQESPLASPLTNQALARINPTRALDESTQTDFTTPNSTEENWEVTFLTSGYVRVEITVRESNGQLRQPTELLMPEGEFFNRPRAERCNFFRFQLG